MISPAQFVRQTAITLRKAQDDMDHANFCMVMSGVCITFLSYWNVPTMFLWRNWVKEPWLMALAFFITSTSIAVNVRVIWFWWRRKRRLKKLQKGCFNVLLSENMAQLEVNLEQVTCALHEVLGIDETPER